jgi:DNA mismatch repair protein MutS
VSFASVLFDGTERSPVLEPEPPPFFGDLNLDQVVDSITRGREDYDLKPFFHNRLTTLDAIAYRHEVFRDLENEVLLSQIASFAKEMLEMRKHLAQAEKLRYYRYEQEAWLLEAAEIYCEAVGRLAHDLDLADLSSRSLRAIREYLSDYVESDRFTTLLAETKRVKEGLAGVQYSLTIKGNRIRVGRYELQADYSAEIEQTFERFKQGAVKDYRAGFPASVGMDHVEANIMNLVAQLYPDVFSALDACCERHRNYLDETVGAFDREIQFYVAYVEYVERLAAGGLRFCFPQVSVRSKEVAAREAFDIALANKLVPEGEPVVCNDFYLNDPERIIVVSGPNQGGKTTFARMFGQLHYLASLGCLVPGGKAQLYLFDELFTHFEKEEDIMSLSGKLEDDLVRVHEILDRATTASIVIMNESFTSTTLNDALLLGRAVMEQIIEQDLLCVYVTFVDELASLSETTVSMVSTVSPEDPATRTYKVERRPADGLAYAAAIAEKYGLTYGRLRERLPS